MALRAVEDCTQPIIQYCSLDSGHTQPSRGVAPVLQRGATDLAVHHRRSSPIWPSSPVPNGQVTFDSQAVYVILSYRSVISENKVWTLAVGTSTSPQLADAQRCSERRYGPGGMVHGTAHEDQWHRAQEVSDTTDMGDNLRTQVYHTRLICQITPQSKVMARHTAKKVSLAHSTRAPHPLLRTHIQTRRRASSNTEWRRREFQARISWSWERRRLVCRRARQPRCLV